MQLLTATKRLEILTIIKESLPSTPRHLYAKLFFCLNFSEQRIKRELRTLDDLGFIETKFADELKVIVKGTPQFEAYLKQLSVNIARYEKRTHSDVTEI